MNQYLFTGLLVASKLTKSYLLPTNLVGFVCDGAMTSSNLNDAGELFKIFIFFQLIKSDWIMNLTKFWSPLAWRLQWPTKKMWEISSFVLSFTFFWLHDDDDDCDRDTSPTALRQNEINLHACTPRKLEIVIATAEAKVLIIIHESNEPWTVTKPVKHWNCHRTSLRPQLVCPHMEERPKERLCNQ